MKERIHPGSDGPAVLLPSDGERTVMGHHRLPGPERTCPAWPDLEAFRRTRAARLTRFINGAQPVTGWRCPYPAERSSFR